MPSDKRDKVQSLYFSCVDSFLYLHKMCIRDRADTYAICVGAGNSYGHPHDQVLNRISGKQVYRTDLNGDIVIGTDGANLTVQTEK